MTPPKNKSYLGYDSRTGSVVIVERTDNGFACHPQGQVSDLSVLVDLEVVEEPASESVIQKVIRPLAAIGRFVGKCARDAWRVMKRFFTCPWYEDSD